MAEFAPECAGLERTDSAVSEDSQTAEDFINSQLQLEAEAREALPYKFDTCTRPLGQLRQLLFACLTCNPPPKKPTAKYQPAAVCYSCSISCHPDHELVELFHKRNFTCDCGTTRLPKKAPCMLRENDKGKKGATGEKPDERNQYNQNFQNRFCGCEDEYDPQQQSGTMYQCIGLNGGCGEDWWHPTCIVGLDSSWYKRAVKDHKKAKEAAKKAKAASKPATSTSTDTVAVGESAVDEEDDDEDDGPVPPGFPDDNMFESFICYKCVEAQPWIKKYAGAPGFLEPVFRRSLAPSPEDAEKVEVKKSKDETVDTIPIVSTGLKRKADDDDEESSQKKAKTDTATVAASASTSAKTCTVVSRPTPTGTFSLCCITDFRTKLCRCGDCFPLLASHPQLLDEEDIYEPPMSETSSVHGASGGGSVASLLDRGERALSTMDRVKAIEGVMAFNKLKEGLTPFFREFAETGKVISAEDVKRHFAKMRGDDGNGLNEFPDGQAR